MRAKRKYNSIQLIRPGFTIEYRGIRGIIIALWVTLLAFVKLTKIFRVVPPSWRWGKKPLFYIVSIPKVKIVKQEGE